MIDYLCCSRSFSKQLAVLRRSSKKGEWAVEQVENILEIIKTEGVLADAVYCKRTKNGEYRLRNCVKYDLGNGYRMVTIKCGRHLLVPFIGDHDCVDQWLDRHRYDDFSADEQRYDCIQLDVKPDEDEANAVCNRKQAPDTLDSYEEEVMAKVDDSVLKYVFPGLFR